MIVRGALEVVDHTACAQRCRLQRQIFISISLWRVVDSYNGKFMAFMCLKRLTFVQNPPKSPLDMA